jgi:hypothetical protein
MMEFSSLQYSCHELRGWPLMMVLKSSVLRAWIVTLCAGVSFLTAGPLRAAVIFQFTYFDVVNGNGIGFDDPVLGAARRAAAEATAAQMGARLAHSATVQVGIAPSQTDGTGPIGIASASFNVTTPGIRDGEIYRRIVLGAPDTTPMQLDAGMVFDFGYPTALTGTPALGVTYFPDVFRHELTHAMGFGSFLAANGTGFNGTAPDMYTRYDSFLTTDGGANPGLDVIDAAGNLLVDAGTFAAAYSSGLVFDGPTTRAANGGLPLKLYFSSPSHSASPNDVMFVSPAVGRVRDDWSALDVAVLKDLGYQFVPEPTTAGMGAAMLGLVVASARPSARRRRGAGVAGKRAQSTCAMRQ